MEAPQQPPWLGLGFHRIPSMIHLRFLLTRAWQARRLLSTEERMAMLLNPHPFRWPNIGNTPYTRLTRNGMFLVVNAQQFLHMAQLVGAFNNQWAGYRGAAELREEKKVGISKTRKRGRNVDNREVTLVRYEVKGRLRLRRRTVLPCDFFRRTQFAIPYPGLSVVEYRLYPDVPKGIHDHFVQQMEMLEEDLRNLLGEAAVPLPEGPPEPPGLLTQEEMADYLQAEAAVGGDGGGPGGGGGGQGRGGQGRGRGRGRGRGGEQP